jgi:hypothetical protein
MKMCQTTLLLIASFAALSALAQAQAFTGPGDSSSADETIAPARIEQIDSSYVRPSQATKLRNYAFDAFGPYPIFGAAVVAGIGQADNTVPEWKQGAAGFGRRLQRPAPRPATRWDKYSGKTLYTTAANAEDYSRD